MVMKMLDVFTSASFVGYIDKRIKELEEQLVLKSIFPDKKTMSMDYSYIKTTNGAIELSAPSAFDAEPIAQQRSGFDAMSGDMPLFRRKMVLSEKERQRLMIALQTGNVEMVKSILSEIYDDQMTLVKGARMTMEFLRSRVLMDGKITIASKGGAVNLDYKVPAENKVTLSGGTDEWDNPECKIVDQIQGWLDKVEDATGVRPDTAIMNRKTFRYLRENKQIRNNLLPASLLATGTVADGQIISDTLLESAFKTLTGISNVIVYNAKVTMDKKMYDLIEDNKVTFFPSAVAMGNTLIGVSPAEFNAQNIANAGNEISITSEGIAVSMKVNDTPPYTAETFAEFIAVPTFTGSDFVFQATVVSE